MLMLKRNTMRLVLSRIDELEGNKTKLQMRLQESEETIDSLHTKVTLIVIRELDRHDKEDGFGRSFFGKHDPKLSPG